MAFDIRGDLTSIKDQGKRNTCVAFAATAGHEYLKKNDLDLSEEFLYWGCKKYDGQLFDNGTSLNSAVYCLKNYGQPGEEHWPYDPTCTVSSSSYYPSKEAWEEAKKNMVIYGERIPIDIDFVKQILSKNYAVIIGIVLFEEFFRPLNGLVDYPQNTSQQYGGHAVLVTGWDDDLNNGVFVIRNSWGEQWGLDGYGFIPYSYFMRFTVDAWSYYNN